jgi:hypothetical protein
MIEKTSRSCFVPQKTCPGTDKVDSKGGHVPGKSQRVVLVR